MPRGQLVNSSCFCKWRLSLSVLLLFLLLLPLLLPVNEFSEKGPNKTQIEREGGEEREEVKPAGRKVEKLENEQSRNNDTKHRNNKSRKDNNRDNNKQQQQQQQRVQLTFANIL